MHVFKKKIPENIFVQFALPHSLILRPKPKSISNKMHTSEKFLHISYKSTLQEFWLVQISMQENIVQ